MKTFLSFLATFVIFLQSSLVFSANINVSPVTLFLSNEEPVTTVTVANDADEPVTLQANPVKWEQIGKKDVTYDTQDMIISPPIFNLAPHHSQLVRIAWLKGRSLTQQLTYRVLFRQIPNTNFMPHRYDSHSLEVLLAISLPLFVQPEHLQLSYYWQGKWLDNNHLKLSLMNSGNVTLSLNQFSLINNKTIYSQKTFLYLFPQHQNNWTININKQSVTEIKALINGEWMDQVVKFEK